MESKIRKGGFALVLSLLVLVCSIFEPLGTKLESYAYAEREAAITATSLNVRSGAGTSHSIVDKILAGTTVTVVGEANAPDGELWYQIRFPGSKGGVHTGYTSAKYVKFRVDYTPNSNFEAHLEAEGFPESYKVRLRQLHAEYPSWVFRAQKTNLDWNTVIQNESLVSRNLVHKNSPSSWKSTAEGAYNWNTGTWPGFDGEAWVAASEGIIRYYMDPRNFLDGVNIFQFITQSHSSTSSTREGLQTMIKGTFMDGSASGSSSSNQPPSGTTGGYGPGYVNSSSGSSSPDNQAPTSSPNPPYKLKGPGASISRKNVDIVANPESGESTSSVNISGNTIPYVDILMKAGEQSGVNAYVLAAMIIQEQGSQGSPSVTGTVSGYEGYYNFYNIGAFQSGNMSAIQKGLSYASQSGSYGRPWNSIEKSILGGASYYGDSYVKAGQDTFYLKKFNVQGENLYKHQYMTNVQGAAGEGVLFAKAYNDEMKKGALEFKIPVFTNMPEQLSEKPVGDGSPNNKLSSLSVDGYGLTPTFNQDVTEYSLIVDGSVSSVTIQAAVIDQTASVSGAGTVSLQAGQNEIRIQVRAQNGTIREYRIQIVR